MGRNSLLAILAIVGLVSSGYAFAQTNKAVQETMANIGQSAAISAVPRPMPTETMPVRPIACQKTSYGGCISIVCDDGFSMKQCQTLCTSYVDENGCKVTVCNGVETKECPQVAEQVTCIFQNTYQPQKCYSELGGCTAHPTGCKEGKVCPAQGTASCSMKVSGGKGETVTWKSSCGGYGTTTIDGNDEKVGFVCSQACNTYTAGNGCIVKECPGQPTVTACPLMEKAN
ncbi:MAG: hypothetical protein V1875_03330 [Candidatus Altiarchaeota archaeon]